jgi:prepilin-type N-terminal cleavage/methylation domain-containing protein
MRYKFEIANADRTAAAPNSELLTHHSKGFTLIEIIITIVLIGVLSTIAAVIILQGIRAYSEERTRSDVHYQARIAMERMAREIRTIRSQTAGDITTMAAANLAFCDITGKAIEFSLAGTVLNRRESATCNPPAWGGWNALANGVGPLTFTYRDVAGASGAAATDLWFVEIDMTDTQGSETMRMRTKVHPRNF